MYLFYTDETNTEPTSSDFFIYGGIILDSKYIFELNEEIDKIRKKAGYKTGDLLKFNTRSRPAYVTIENFVIAKENLLNLCIKYNVVFVAYLIYHKIVNDKIKFSSAINHITSCFNMFLEEKNDYGICIYDRLPKTQDQFNLIKENYSKGLDLKKSWLRLEKIVLNALSCAGASNIYSAADIVLGSFRYCVNDPRNKLIAKKFLTQISSMVWGEKKNGVIYCIEKGIILRPKVIKVYKDKYDKLIENINFILNYRY